MMQSTRPKPFTRKVRTHEDIANDMARFQQALINDPANAKRWNRALRDLQDEAMGRRTF